MGREGVPVWGFERILGSGIGDGSAELVTELMERWCSRRCAGPPSDSRGTPPLASERTLEGGTPPATVPVGVTYVGAPRAALGGPVSFSFRSLGAALAGFTEAGRSFGGDASPPNMDSHNLDSASVTGRDSLRRGSGNTLE